MMDLQAVYIRDRVRLRDVSVVSMLRIRADTADARGHFGSVTEARIAGQAVPFFREPGGDLLLSFPTGVLADSLLHGNPTYANLPVWLYAIPGASAHDALLPTKRIVGEDFTTTLVLQQEAAQKPPDWQYLVPPVQMVVDESMLRITGQDFRKAVLVRVNGLSTPFTILSQTTLLCGLPGKTNTITDVEVVASVARITGTSYFAYLLGQNPTSVSGMDKLLGQFIKALLTTPGSDTFHKDFGGGMQKWVGQSTDQSGNAMASRAVMQIEMVAAKMTAGQFAANLPPDEVLLMVEIHGITVSPADPTSLEISLSLRSLSSELASVNMLVGGALALAQQATGA